MVTPIFYYIFRCNSIQRTRMPKIWEIGRYAIRYRVTLNSTPRIQVFFISILVHVWLEDTYWPCWLDFVRVTSFYAPRRSGGGIKFYPCPTYVRTSHSLFPFSTLYFLNQLVWNLYTNMLVTTKYRSGLNFGDVTFTILELCPLTNGKIAKFFVSVLLFFNTTHTLT